MNWYEKDRKRSEKGDVNIITSFGVGISMLNLVLVMYIENYIYIYITIIIVMFLIAIYNYFQIYVKYNKKYKTGNSYVKRKFGTIGIFLVNIQNIYIFLAYLMYLKDIDIFILIAYLIGGAIIIIPLEHYLVNKLWFNFDKKKYAEIDKNNPRQKRYWNENKSLYNR